LLARTSELQVQVHSLELELETSTTAFEHERSLRAAVENERDAIRASCTALEKERDAPRASWSWRVTGRLRLLAAQVRKLRR
jgi:hypothetical protein